MFYVVGNSPDKNVDDSVEFSSKFFTIFSFHFLIPFHTTRNAEEIFDERIVAFLWRRRCYIE